MARRSILSAGLLLAGLAMTTAAIAGYVYKPEVVVDYTNRVAHGSMAGARFSSDSSQYIGCTSHSTTSINGVLCSAYNASGSGVSCSITASTVPAAIYSAVRAINSSSYVKFNWVTDSNEHTGKRCTNLLVGNGSHTIQ